MINLLKRLREARTAFEEDAIYVEDTVYEEFRVTYQAYAALQSVLIELEGMEPEFMDQPVVVANDGMIRFSENRLVEHLLDWATPRGCGMNELAVVEAPDWARRQFAQLIGYSVSGYSELSYVDDAAYERAMNQRAALLLIQKGGQDG